MSSSVTIWTSGVTAQIQPRVAQTVREIRGETAPYDSISLVGCDVAEAVERIGDAFNRLVKMTVADASLHIVAVVPMFERDSVAQIRLLYDACAATDHSITLHVLGLADGLRALFDSGKEPVQSQEAIALLKELCGKPGFSMSYTLIDNYAENGSYIGFTPESLARYIALIQSALMQDYYQILPPQLLSAHGSDNLSMGVSALSFERDAVARQLLGLGFIEVLDNVGINQGQVDAQKAAREAETFLAGIDERYPLLFESEIYPLFKDKRVDEGRVVAQSAEILDKDIDSLKSGILGLLTSPRFSLPEKEAILALILGRDNERLRGMQYEQEGTLLDDACKHPIDLYVEAFNRDCINTTLLPKRSDYEALKKYVWNPDKEEFEESSENGEALNPLPEIKRLKQEIINTTSFIREKNDELAALQALEAKRKDGEEIKNLWRKPQGNLKDVEYKEQPLDKQYAPPRGLKPKDAVDLRKFFGPVRNQSKLGACTSFAAAAMYEAMMNKAGVTDSEGMSPAFLYYYSNVITGRPSGGSNFHEQLAVLGSRGICREEQYAYDAMLSGDSPSEQAQTDASQHRVIEARQIPLANISNKSETLKRNHQLLTAALSEGYPVGVSLKVYDNLGRSGAFILHPSETPDAKEDGMHAMVIVGYSEENNFYIVRNSWGTEFGDDGYCYIPTAYMDDPDYLDFACIITETTESGAGGNADVPSVVADFGATQTEISIAAIRNAIARIKVDLATDQRLYAEYYAYYQRLVLQLTMPKVQAEIRKSAEEAQRDRIEKLNRMKSKLEDSFVATLKDYKRTLLKIIVSLCSATLLFGMSWYYVGGYILGLFTAVAGGALALTITGYPWWVKIKRRRQQEELDALALKVKRLQDEWLVMHIRYHVAGMWLSRFHKLSIELNGVYDRLVSYNSSLRGWYDTYTAHIGAIEPPEGQMFRTLDASPCLRGFFEQNKTVIVKGVDLLGLFERYQSDPEELETYHRELQQSVLDAIYSLLAGFNIAEFLLGDTFGFLKPVNLQQEMTTLINLGQPSYRNRAMYATSAIQIILADIPLERQAQWVERVDPCFPMRPMLLRSSSPTLLLLLTLHPQEIG